MTTEISLSQLICSRLCHDLVGAAGAINAGIELLGEDPSDLAAPLELMATSAEQVTRRLSFFRVAFGAASGADRPMDPAALRKLIDDYLSDKKIQITWNDINFEKSSPQRISLAGKLLCLMMVILNDCLPRGGDANVHLAPMEGGLGIAVEGRGPDVRLPDPLQQALDARQVNDQLTARNVHAYFANQLAISARGSLELVVGAGIVQIACMLPD